MDTIRSALVALLADEHPMTVRQVFYRMVSLGLIEKTEADYKRTVVRLLTELRLAKIIPFDAIADHTRWIRKPQSYGSLAEMLGRATRTYRRALWDTQPAIVEVWCEKDALAGVLLEETAPWDVPLMVARGYASLTYLYEAAEQYADADKPVFLYYFGDHDPSGVNIREVVERRLREFAPDAEIHFEPVAVTPEQIAAWGLPTRPTKATDSRAKGFADESVELDTIPPADLRALVRECIEQHIDPAALERMRTIEAAERATLKAVIETMTAPRPRRSGR